MRRYAPKDFSLHVYHGWEITVAYDHLTMRSSYRGRRQIKDPNPTLLCYEERHLILCIDYINALEGPP